MKQVATSEAFPDAAHDHAECISTALAAAEDTCRREGLRLTPIRRRVLELVWQNHRPVGAYDLLDQLSRDGKRAMPPTVYRALEFLQGAGLVHRIATLNAFVGCSHPDHAHQCQFLICSDCRTVVELESEQIGRSLKREAAALGFQVREQSVELTGLCPECHSTH